MTSTTMPRPVRGGRHALQIPGPTNTPGPVLRAIAQPTIDHRGPEFAALARGVLRDLPQVFGTSAPVVMFPASGTGAWDAALVNVTSPGDRVVIAETGHFTDTWHSLATHISLHLNLIPGTWGRCAPPRDQIGRASC